MQGTLRTFDPEVRDFVMRRVAETVATIAQSAGAEATAEWWKALVQVSFDYLTQTGKKTGG